VSTATDTFRAARDLLLRHRTDYDAAMQEFAWPQLPAFNWALDHFDALALGNATTALWIVDDSGNELKRSFDELRIASDRSANWLRDLGVQRGDRLLVMLPNRVELWELMLAAIKLGAVLAPATQILSVADLQDRIERGEMRAVICDHASTPKFEGIADGRLKIVVGGEAVGWTSYAGAAGASAAYTPDRATKGDDPCVVYFTSGTTSKPKMVLHTQTSYPVGHLSTMYWLGLQPGDVHLNISSPGWAKHAWSCFFAPWQVGATVFIYNQGRFDSAKTLATIARCGVTSLCAPPTAWRSLILEDLKAYPIRLRELTSAGEPLNPEVIEQVKAAWGITIREGFGQTESTAMLGNSPGQPVRYGSMGRPLPGYAIDLLDLDGNAAKEGEISVRLSPRPTAIMAGYAGDAAKTGKALGGSHYGTADVASIDADGWYWYVGRTDDVFKSSDYRISPFELESALMEHPAVAEVAVLDSPDARRLAVPKACVVLAPGHAPTADTAKAVLLFARTRLAPYQKIRVIEFCELPKTVSGKVRRNELRAIEAARRAAGERGAAEWLEADFPELLEARRA
jgi:acetyl-CoA synthetase